jgi:hypothetical protein
MSVVPPTRGEAFVGLVPTESSSGQSRSPGSITKTGNTHARRLVVEAAWHHAKPYRMPGKTMRDRWELAPPAARVRGHEGNRRLHQRWQGFNARKKRPAAPTSPSPASLPAGPGRSPCSKSKGVEDFFSSVAVSPVAARGTTHDLTMTNHDQHLS